MKVFVLLLSILVSTVAFANGSSGEISLQDKRIQIIADSVNPRVFVYDIEISNGECLQTTPVLSMKESSILAQETYAMLLAAKASGKKVKIVTKGCMDNNPVIYAVYLY